MKWIGGKTLLLVLLLFCLSLGLVSAQQPSSSPQPLPIYEEELNKLLENVTKLSMLNNKQKNELRNLQITLDNQNQELMTLRMELSDSQRRIDALLKDLTDLKAQLQSSQAVLEELRIQLQKAEDSYKSLWASFLTYQRETEKQINKYKAERFWLGFGMAAGWVTASTFAILWLTEKY